MGPLGTVKLELLVRCLDAWTPAAIHSAKRVTYVDGYPTGPVAAAATRVFTEFADQLPGHRLTVLLAGAQVPAELGELPAGLDARPVPGDLLASLREDRALAAPIFSYLDSVGRAPPDPELLSGLGGARAAEILLIRDAAGEAEAIRKSLLDAGFRFAVVVELVDNAGQAEWAFFATSAVRTLERFKDALWAVDEYAGVRYRDPRTSDHPPLDISLEPHVGPLRRALLARLAADGGADTVAQLREYALSDTVYRPADVNRALAPLLSAGQVTREPERGRLTPRTMIRR